MLRLALELQLMNLGVGQIPKFKTPSCGFQERCAARRDFREGALRQRVARAKRQQIFLLRGQQVGTVKSEEGITLPHLLPGGIHKDLLDPTVDLHVDVHQPCFVHGHLAHGAQGFVERAVLGLGCGDSHQLLPRGADLDASRRERWRRDLGGVNRHELHAAVRRDPGFIRVIPGVHGILVVENLSALRASTGPQRLPSAEPRRAL